MNFSKKADIAKKQTTGTPISDGFIFFQDRTNRETLLMAWIQGSTGSFLWFVYS